MRRTKEDAEKTRCAILAAAEQLFLERGVAHTSLEHIARHAGVTRGAVYWHFQNKAHLFHEMLNQVRLPLEPLAEQLDDATMRQLNAKVDVEHQSPTRVAAAYLRQHPPAEEQP